MNSSPDPHSKQRAIRVQIPDAPKACIRFGDGHQSTAKLQTLSLTGGLLRVVKPLPSGVLIELAFPTHIGGVLAMAELLDPCPAVRIGLQPFRFISIDNSDLCKLRAAIASCLERETKTYDQHGS